MLSKQEPQTLGGRVMRPIAALVKKQRKCLLDCLSILKVTKKYRFFLRRLMIFSIIAQITLVSRRSLGLGSQSKKSNNNENTF
jgi:hypothetical protein